jgi:hypothetical protein
MMLAAMLADGTIRCAGHHHVAQGIMMYRAFSDLPCLGDAGTQVSDEA